ncbi:beta-ketoacyl-ACP synthase II [Paenibacillus illinoisensis]|uniref:beta-ketoacyl-ACP synthase II n=1 Tax=Paenibacillus illinoisensis TaxID=59845 RepID=UPI003019C4D5
MNKRVVITGTGIISSLGTGTEAVWSKVKQGISGITTLTKFDNTGYSTKVAAEIRNFSPLDFIQKKELKKMDQFCQYAIACTRLAFEESKICLEEEDRSRIGVIVGTGIGGMDTIEKETEVFQKKGPGRNSPFTIPMLLANMAPSRIAIEFGLRGFNECVITACATSNNAIGDAFKVIQRGSADVMVTGGTEASLTPIAFSAFCSTRAMTNTDDPELACRPFDADRNGFVMGEGAGILILEELEHALKRDANIIGEIVGYGCNCDAYHIIAPHPEGLGAMECMNLAIQDAGIQANEIGYINAHGTSTKANDITETKAIKNVFNEHAKHVAISSTKSMTGHLMGAAGGIEAIITVLSLKEGFLPPTINYKTPDIDCDLDYVANEGRHTEIEYALSNGFGFGGHNATLLFKKFAV